MNTISNKWSIWLLSLAAIVGNAYAVERPNPTLEERVTQAELVVAIDDINLLPRTPPEFDKFFRIEARVLKGRAETGERIEIVVDNTISELGNECCSSGKAYVVFLREKDDKYYFVGSPLGSIPLDLSER